MTRTMYDAVSPNNIPSNAPMVAGYSNGRYAWNAAAWQRFSHIPHATIDVNGSNPHADVLDVEPGDASVAGAVAWTKKKLALHPHYPPIIYANRSTLTPLFNAMHAGGLEIVRDFRLWIATLDGTTRVHDMTGVTAVQYTDYHDRYDLSNVYDPAWNPGIATVTPTPAKPSPKPVTPLAGSLTYDGKTRSVHSYDGGVTWR